MDGIQNKKDPRNVKLTFIFKCKEGSHERKNLEAERKGKWGRDRGWSWENTFLKKHLKHLENTFRRETGYDAWLSVV